MTQSISKKKITSDLIKDLNPSLTLLTSSDINKDLDPLLTLLISSDLPFKQKPLGPYFDQL